MKLVAIGIGSVIFGIELLRDVFRVPELKAAELWLVDVHLEALARMTRLAERLNEAADWDVAVHATTDRREALPGADFVVTAVAIDRIATWRADHDLALRHGFASVLSENGGPGGLAHTLRSVPLMVEIGRDVAELAPNCADAQLHEPGEPGLPGAPTPHRLPAWSGCATASPRRSTPAPESLVDLGRSSTSMPPGSTTTPGS